MDHLKWIIRGPFLQGSSSVSWHDHCKGLWSDEEMKWETRYLTSGRLSSGHHVLGFSCPHHVPKADDA